MSGFSSINLSAAMLIPSCAPSVRPSVPNPLASPAVPARNTPGAIPDFSSIFSVIPTFIGPERFLARAAGSIESSAAAAEPNKRAVPAAVSPVSWYMFWNISGAFRAYDPNPAPANCPKAAWLATVPAAAVFAASVAALVANALPPNNAGAAAPPVKAVVRVTPRLGICSPIVSETNLVKSPTPSISLKLSKTGAGKAACFSAASASCS